MEKHITENDALKKFDKIFQILRKILHYYGSQIAGGWQKRRIGIIRFLFLLKKRKKENK